MMASDSPPLFPGTQVEYTSAVSMKFSPASTAASSSLNDVASSTVQPNTLVPRQSGGTIRSERPSRRLFMGVSPVHRRSGSVRDILKGRVGLHASHRPASVAQADRAAAGTRGKAQRRHGDFFGFGRCGRFRGNASLTMQAHPFSAGHMEFPKAADGR